MRKLPSDLSVLKDVPEIIVLGDNDNAGRKQNEIVAHQFHLTKRLNMAKRHLLPMLMIKYSNIKT